MEYPLKEPHGLGGGLGEGEVAHAGEEEEHHLGVRGALEGGPLQEEPVAEELGVGEVAVVGDGQDPVGGAGGEGLGVDAQVGARGGVAGVGDAQAGLRKAELPQALLGEDLVHEAQVLFHQERFAVRDRHPRRLLAPVLQGEEAEVEKPRHVHGAFAPKPEDAALLLGLIHPAPP